METSMFISQLLGLMYLTFGAGFLLNSAYYQKEFVKMFDNTLLMFYGGIMALVIGVAMVHFHNFWVKDWTVVVTIFGWAALLKGVALIVFPRSFMVFKPLFQSKTLLQVMPVGVLLIGAFFAYFGFGLG